MSPRTGSFSVGALVVRILARIAALACILILLVFMVPEDGGSFFGQWDWRHLDVWSIVFPFGYLLGLILILWKDAWGGVISVGCILALYFRFAPEGDSMGLVLSIGVVPGILAIIAWWLSKRHEARALPRVP